MDKQIFRRGNESQRTYRLKLAAEKWLYNTAQCRSIGMEVKLEGPGGRIVDLVGVGPGNTIYVVEVKASRADFKRDNHTPADLAGLKERIDPLLRRGRLARQTLTQAMDYAKRVRPEGWEEEPAYRSALADCDRLGREEKNYRNRLATFSVKFHDPSFLNIADYHYIMAPRALALTGYMPPKWGLLDETPAVVIEAQRKEIRKTLGIVSNVLRAIGRSNTNSIMRAQGFRMTEEGAVLPEEWSG